MSEFTSFLRKNPHQLLLVAAIIGLPRLLFGWMDLDKAAPLALFFSVVILWFTELIPLPVTALLVPVLAVAWGILDAKAAFGAFGNEILFLFIGSFLLARAMEKHGLDLRLAGMVLRLRWSTASAGRLVLSFALISFGLSMWISNTAACAIMVPIALGVISAVEKKTGRESASRFSVWLLLTCSFAASIGGLATPVGTPPNLLALGILAEHGIRIDFFRWMLFALPVSLAMLLVMLLLLRRRYDSGEKWRHLAGDLKEALGEELPRWSRQQIQVMACFFLAVTLWVIPGIVKSMAPEGFWDKWLEARLPMGLAGLAAALPLFFLSSPGRTDGGVEMNLTWEDARQIDWGTVMLFGGGLCLGQVLSRTGLAADLGTAVFRTDSFLLILILAAALGIITSEISSNTASASVLIPILMASFPDRAQAELVAVVLAATFGAGFGFMLPVSTPPNAIVYGTEKVPLREMILSGSMFDLAGLAIITAAAAWFLPPLLG